MTKLITLFHYNGHILWRKMSVESFLGFIIPND